MSRIGKKIIALPKGTEANLSGSTFTIKGPNGSLVKDFKNNIDIVIAPEQITLLLKKDTLANRALWGTYSSHITNMVKGVTTPFVKKLIIEGIGYKSEVKGDKLVLALGFSHGVSIDIPKTLNVKAEKNIVTISGINKEEVGGFAANLRDWKRPEPYKGKGIRYEDEVVKRKQGKKSA